MTPTPIIRAQRPLAISRTYGPDGELMNEAMLFPEMTFNFMNHDGVLIGEHNISPDRPKQRTYELMATMQELSEKVDRCDCPAHHDVSCEYIGPDVLGNASTPETN